MIDDAVSHPAEVGSITEPASTRKMISMIIPAFNEALKIMTSLNEIYTYLQALNERYDFEIIVIDDGSTDETADIAALFAASRPEVRLIRQPENMRLGRALRDGFHASCGDVVIVFDSDLSYGVEHIGQMLDAHEETRAEIVIASPYMKGGKTSAIPWRRAQMSRQINRVLAASSLYNVSTFTGMVRAYEGAFIRSLALKAGGPDINTEIMYKAQIMRARVVEIPAHLDWSDQAERMQKRKVRLRVSNTSKLLVFATFLFRPIFFFVVPGLLLLAVSIWSAGSLFLTVIDSARGTSGGIDNRLTDGFARAWELRPQTFIIAGFTFVVAVQLISLGLLAVQAKRYFEELYFTAVQRSKRADSMLVGPDH